MEKAIEREFDWAGLPEIASVSRLLSSSSTESRTVPSRRDSRSWRRPGPSDRRVRSDGRRCFLSGHSWRSLVGLEGTFRRDNQVCGGRSGAVAQPVPGGLVRERRGCPRHTREPLTARLERFQRFVTAAGHTMEIARSDRGESVRLFDKEKAPYQMKNIADDREAVLDELTDKLNEELVRIGDPWVGA
jgi:hypothetical protein